jgi:hypothetical protein
MIEPAQPKMIQTAVALKCCLGVLITVISALVVTVDSARKALAATAMKPEALIASPQTPSCILSDCGVLMQFSSGRNSRY